MTELNPTMGRHSLPTEERKVKGSAHMPFGPGNLWLCKYTNGEYSLGIGGVWTDVNLVFAHHVLKATYRANYGGGMDYGNGHEPTESEWKATH